MNDSSKEDADRLSPPDRSDNEREKHNHDRLERRSHGCDRVVHFVIVNIRDFQKHLGQLSGFFADVDHADDHRRKRATGFERLHDRFAFLYAIVHLRDRAGDHHVAGSFAGDVERL